MIESDAMTAEELDEILTWSIVRVARFAGQRLADRLAEQGLNPIQFGVLAHLAISPEMTQADLARAVLVRPQSIAPLLDGLQERGWITRTGDRARGRRNPVHITEAGRQILGAAKTIALAANDFSDAGLDRPEREELNRLLLKVIRSPHGSHSSSRSGD